MRILLAPDKFKDALTADDICAAMAEGVRAALPEADVLGCPLGDGGEGTGRLLARALLAQERVAIVRGPLGRERAARWWYLPARQNAIIEMAEACGLHLLCPSERRAMRASSFGAGQLLRAALDAGVRQIWLTVGGSATVDGGAGFLQALGWRLFDAGGRELPAPACGAVLPRIAALEPPRDWALVPVEVLCDVDNPLVGAHGAAAVFAPQKGAGPDEVRALAAGLEIWADVLETTTRRSVRTLPGGGAAGGLPAALAAACLAELARGFDRVADLVGLDDKLRGCNLCLTGEGRLDEQTAGGKVVAGVARRGRATRVPVVAFVGAVRCGAGGPAELARQLGLESIQAISPEGLPLEQAIAQTAGNLARAIAEYLAGRSEPRP
jgi:glycerate kinase